MAAVVLKYVTEEAGKFSGNDHNSGHKRKMVDEFLTGKGWHFIGNQVFHSEPSFGTAREQMVSQARAIWDIEELLKWKPTLKDYLKDSLVIVGQVYDINSLIESSSVKRLTRKKGDDNRSTALLELVSTKNYSVMKDRAFPNDGTAKASIANPVKAMKLDQPKIKSLVKPKVKNTTRPARFCPMGSTTKATSHQIVNFPKTPVKTAKSKSGTTLLNRPGHSLSDMNSNLLSGASSNDNQSFDEDDMTPLYLTCLEEDDDHGEKDVIRDFARLSGYHVETFVTRDVCTKKLCCSNVNMDPSERVVV